MVYVGPMVQQQMAQMKRVYRTCTICLRKLPYTAEFFYLCHKGYQCKECQNKRTRETYRKKKNQEVDPLPERLSPYRDMLLKRLEESEVDPKQCFGTIDDSWMIETDEDILSRYDAELLAEIEYYKTTGKVWRSDTSILYKKEEEK